jgi:hypothetical protein
LPNQDANNIVCGGDKMDYLELLENSFKTECCGNKHFDKYSFIAEEIFDITTYDDGMSSLFGKKAMEVFKAITEKKTFDYIKNDEDYKWYITFVNFPFFYRKLTWGTSIRGAWWDICTKMFEINSCGLFLNDEQITELTFNEEEWNKFTKAMIEFIST